MSQKYMGNCIITLKTPDGKVATMPAQNLTISYNDSFDVQNPSLAVDSLFNKKYEVEAEITNEYFYPGIVTSENKTLFILGKKYTIPMEMSVKEHLQTDIFEFTYSHLGITTKYAIVKELLIQAGTKEEIDFIVLKAVHDCFVQWARIYAENNFKAKNDDFVVAPPKQSGKYTYTATGNENFDLQEKLVSELIPSLKEIVVNCPAGCPSTTKESYYRDRVWTMIQHLNDKHKWSREGQIADWLDSLHDAGIIDLTLTGPDPDKA